MAEHDMDAIGAEAAAMMKTMLQLATLVALRTRERGQKEAEQRVKVTQARAKEANELAARQVRESKARDPRNVEIQRMIERTGVVLSKNRSTLDRENQTIEAQQQQLGRDQADFNRMSAAAEAQRIEADRLVGEQGLVQVMDRDESASVLQFDSAERRMALALELAELGVEPELIEVRMLAEMAQGKPPIDAAREPINGPTPMGPELGNELGLDRSRGIEGRG
jgi:hypothetical protein